MVSLVPLFIGGNFSDETRSKMLGCPIYWYHISRGAQAFLSASYESTWKFGSVRLIKCNYKNKIINKSYT